MDIYILVKRTITAAGQAGDNPNNANKKVKNCVPFTDCISEINNTETDNAKFIDVDMSMYNAIKYSKNYSKTSKILWQYCRDEPALTNAGTIANFYVANNSALFKFKQKTTRKTANCGIKNVTTMVPLKYLIKYWRTLEMPLINCAVNLILTWFDKCSSPNDAKTISTIKIKFKKKQLIGANMNQK